MTSDESTPLVPPRASASAAAHGGVRFSRKATLALVGACAIVSYAAHASSGATASLGAFFRAPGAPGGGPGPGGRGDARAASTGRFAQTLRGEVGESESQMRARSRDNDALRAEAERLGAEHARLSDRRARDAAVFASTELVDREVSGVSLGALTAERGAVRARSNDRRDGNAGNVGERRREKGDEKKKPSRDRRTDRQTSARAFASAEHPECDETMYGARGAGYRGCQSVTRSGLTCQSWAAQTPHQHSLADESAGESAEAAKNHCRNPDGGDSIWCYTTDPNTRFDYCDPRPVGWDYFCAHEGEEMCECASEGGVVVVAARFSFDGEQTEMSWERAVASGAFAAAPTEPASKSKSPKTKTRRRFCDVDELGVDPSPGVAKACWCAPRDAVPVVAGEGTSEDDGSDEAPAPAPYAYVEVDEVDDADFAQFVDSLAEAPGSVPDAVREPETLERAMRGVEEAATKSGTKRERTTTAADVDYESPSDDGSVVDPFEAFGAAPAPGPEPFDPLAFTDAPSGYEALPPVAQPATARDRLTRREREKLERGELDEHYVDELERFFADETRFFADAPEPSADESSEGFEYDTESLAVADSDGYPGTRGCEKTCEGADVSEEACESMFFCHFEKKDRRCWSAVGREPCPATREEMFALLDEQMKKKKHNT